MKLSILIPSIPSRHQMLQELLSELDSQIKDNMSEDEVEVLCLTDLKTMSIGKKRDTLKSIAGGKYFCFLDDDDFPMPGYILKLISAIESDADVITFKQVAVINGKSCVVTFGLKNENEAMRFDQQGNLMPVNRAPFPCCVWKTELVQDIKFPNVGYSEDWEWSKQAIEKCKSSVHIDDILHRYVYDDKISEAPTESNEVWKNPNA